MIMRISYLEDLKELIRAAPDELFRTCGRTKQEILSDNETMELLWMRYQKSVEEYDVDPDYAFKDALAETFNIPLPD